MRCPYCRHPLVKPGRRDPILVCKPEFLVFDQGTGQLTGLVCPQCRRILPAETVFDRVVFLRGRAPHAQQPAPTLG